MVVNCVTKLISFQAKPVFFYNACKTFPVWLQNRLISDRLELVYERFKRVDLMKVESLDRYI